MMSGRISDAVEMAKQVRSEIIKLFEETIPDNPKIKRIDKNCFTINSSNLGNNWSPQYHGFLHSKEIVKMIRGCPIESLSGRLNDIIKKEAFNGVKIHPLQIKRMKEILYDVI